MGRSVMSHAGGHETVGPFTVSVAPRDNVNVFDVPMPLKAFEAYLVPTSQS